MSTPVVHQSHFRARDVAEAYFGFAVAEVAYPRRHRRSATRWTSRTRLTVTGCKIWGGELRNPCGHERLRRCDCSLRTTVIFGTRNRALVNSTANALLSYSVRRLRCCSRAIPNHLPADQSQRLWGAATRVSRCVYQVRTVYPSTPIGVVLNNEGPTLAPVWSAVLTASGSRFGVAAAPANLPLDAVNPPPFQRGFSSRGPNGGYDSARGE